MTTPASQPYRIWRDVETGWYYLIPDQHVLLPGVGRIQDEEGQIQYVDLDTLRAFARTPDAIRAHLEQELAHALEQARAAFGRLRAFVAAGAAHGPAPAGQPADAYFRQLMLSLLGAPPDVASVDLNALDAFSDTVSGAGAMPAQLAALFPEEDRAAVFEGVMGRLREIAGKLDARVLEERDDPAAWIEVLYRELFADDIERKKHAQQARIKTSVSQSIADGLRRQGIRPSADFDTNRES